MRELMAPDFVLVDHRPLGFGEGDREYFIAVSRARTQGASLGVQINQAIQCEHNALLTVLHENRISDYGNEYGVVSCALFVVDSLPRVCRSEWFLEEDYERALARLHELAVPSAAPELENEVSRATRAMLRLQAAGDVGAAAGLVANDFEHESRRTVVSSAGYRGRDAFIETGKLRFEVFPEVIGYEPIAIRGDRLALARVGLRAPNAFEMKALGLYEADATGAITHWWSFDEDDLVSTLDELDERYVAGEGAEQEYMIRRLAGHRRALTARDWDAYEALLDPAFTFVDHRRIGQGAGSRVALLASLRTLTDLAPVMSYVERWLLIDGDVALTRVRDEATNPDGNEYEWEHFVVQQFVAGLLLRAELFPLDAYADARARFDELAITTRSRRSMSSTSGTSREKVPPTST